MTAEVAIMNRHALVLAADSATTVTSLVQGRRQTQYFKGANKLFQLSNISPLGMMIYGSAALQDVPWELIVKEFRRCHGEVSSAKLSDYGPRFFEFVKGHSGLFPEAIKKAEFFERATQTAIFKFLGALETENLKGLDRSDRVSYVPALATELQKELGSIKDQTPTEPVKATDVDAAVAAHAQELTKELLEHLGVAPQFCGSSHPEMRSTAESWRPIFL